MGPYALRMTDGVYFHIGRDDARNIMHALTFPVDQMSAYKLDDGSVIAIAIRYVVAVEVPS